ncbi:Ni,Fe-hydrogenase III large subunit [Raineyella antarctica]|uniref:Ni,Fe-hydrogenase III large subunit n=1 Tax=Raineyella antarctica TaxID=1577474 RepID=A0A1G6GEX7_9ACTN|nr:NADH-quinone oxidoreductase subunit C [Raineyella antarctica]SDB80524.1 Ni,Fe-hydrogenase III large subunit [Raineyella antarctica]
MTRLAPPETVLVTRDQLAAAMATQLQRGLRLALVAAHEDGPLVRGTSFRVVHVFLGSAGERVEVVVEVPRDDAWLPTLAGLSYPAGRFEREIRDLYGIVPRGHPQPYRLVRHGHWPTGFYPMLRDADPAPTFGADQGFPFVEVSGKGVYEIPVGPVHAGMIEPGHFRFSVVGETIVRMYQRLYFAHRGVEKLFEGRPVADGIPLAERISGDTAVGHSLAYAMAVEDALGIEVPEHDRLVRALLLECERLYNHVNDIGAIINDTGLSIVNQHAGRLRETLLRHNARLTGHRLLRGAIRIGGADLASAPDLALVTSVAAEAAELASIATGHGMVANRLDTTAVLPPEQARRLGVLGYVARASGLAVDARADQPFVDLGERFEVITRTTGDVRARFDVRVDEVAVTARLVADLAARIAALEGSGSDSNASASADLPTGPGAGLGVVEAWRGTLVHRIEVDAHGVLTRVKVVDPSFCTWPGLPVALAETIVPDFPLANKSFNMSYAGNDL